jgi:hypothetical protein
MRKIAPKNVADTATDRDVKRGARSVPAAVCQEIETARPRPVGIQIRVPARIAARATRVAGDLNRCRSSAPVWAAAAAAKVTPPLRPY